jgi:chloramphenicol 3-O phosphotransferase
MEAQNHSTTGFGHIVILNGVPRSGKTSIAKVVQANFDGLWMNLGVDGFMKMTPEQFQPGIGLRPGGELPDLEAYIPAMFSGLYEAVAAHSRLGLNVIIDVGHHEAYAVPHGIVADAARRLRGLPVLFVGVRCPIEVVMQRRRDTWGDKWSPGDL